MNSILPALRKWFLTFAQVQLFISLISLPILVAWGLPLSLLSIVGNLFFGPFLTAFLLCSSLVFFTELLHIPNGIFIWVLEHITNIWIWFLQHGSKTWLVHLPHSMVYGTLFCAFCSFAVLQHKKWGRALHSSIIFGSLFAMLLCCSTLISVPSFATITCKKKTISVACKNKALQLVDRGGLGEKINPTSWVQYTLLPELTKKFGTTHITKVITHQTKLPTLHALTSLCKEATIEEVIFTQPQQITVKLEKNIEKIIKHGASVATMR